ncbi:hypothetical protein [Bradyrhizobium sp. HKCCYLRH1062]|uniref:hypothetical protein n=1 Tax=unclassified Bradyrhizobium TaxID=2631580 RepID=UPI003EB726E1
MARPRVLADDIFTSREIALAAGLSPRNFGFLVDEGLAPSAHEQAADGRSGSRLYHAGALAQAALVGALHAAGFELLVSARLAAAFTDEYGASHGRLPANLNVFWRSKALNPGGGIPWGKADRGVPIDQDFWIHHLLRNRSEVYRRNTAVPGDCVVEIADAIYVLTRIHDLALKTSSAASGKALLAAPLFRIVGRGADASIVPIHTEVDTMDFGMDPRSREKMCSLEDEYMTGRSHAVTLVSVNLSLAIRNAFDRLQDVRDRPQAV